MVTINIGRKEAVFFGSVVLAFLAVSLAVAYGTSSPAEMGHSIGELSLPACSNGEVLIKNVNGWGCGSVDTSGSTDTPGSSGSTGLSAGSGCELIFSSPGDRTESKWSQIAVPEKCKNKLCVYRATVTRYSGGKVWDEEFPLYQSYLSGEYKAPESDEVLDGGYYRGYFITSVSSSSFNVGDGDNPEWINTQNGGLIPFSDNGDGVETQFVSVRIPSSSWATVFSFRKDEKNSKFTERSPDYYSVYAHKNYKSNLYACD